MFIQWLSSVYLRISLLILSVFLFIASILYTVQLSAKLEEEERKYMHIISDAYQELLRADLDDRIDFETKLIIENKKIPVIQTDEQMNIVSVNNYDKDLNKHKDFFVKELKNLRNKMEPISISDGQSKYYLFYKQSNLIFYLKVFPFIQFGLLVLFIVLAFFSYASLRAVQQERIWVGMAKETAHQIGTPLSSLIGWIVNIKDFYPEDTYLHGVTDEMSKDVQMLEIVAARFSKIGAQPELFEKNIYERLTHIQNYIRQRSSKKIEVFFPEDHGKELMVKLNPTLFDWVLENILKNALDAMDGKGKITVQLTEDQNHIILDISDTGKGIPRIQLNKIFKPGFTTKKRGWGLGLSLSKRIVERYHKGKLLVKSSQLGIGTTFRIILPK